MRLSIVTLFVFCCVLTAPAAAEEIMSAAKALEKSFKQADRWEEERIVLSPAEVTRLEVEADVTFGGSHVPEVVFYKIYDNRNQLIGHALEDTVVGKWGPIHYLVATDLDGKIVRTLILGFYEIRGRAAAKNRFLRQYMDKSVTDPVRLRKDIDGVSGATITSRSLTDGVRKLLHILQLLEERKDVL